MKPVTLCAGLALLLAGCANTNINLPSELQARKPACSGGDYAVCSDIGHAVRGTQVVPREYRISEPIID